MTQPGAPGQVGSKLPDDPPSKDDPMASLRSMNEEIDRLGEHDKSGPILPCQKPSIAVTLLNASGAPAARAKYSASLPDGSSRSGTLDESGQALFEDVDGKAEDVEAFVEVDDTNPDDPVYKLNVTRAGGSPPKEALEVPGAKMDEERDEYFHVPRYDSPHAKE